MLKVQKNMLFFLENKFHFLNISKEDILADEERH